MPDKRKWILLFVSAAAFFILMIFFVRMRQLESNLKSTTRITQGLRRQLDEAAKEEAEYRKKVEESKTEVENLNAALQGLREEKNTAGQKQEELQRLISGSDKTLQRQNQTISDLEKKLKNAQNKLNKQKRQNAGLEEESRNPAATREYAKLMENEWLAATAKTEELKKDLGKTLSEISSQNKEKAKMQKEVATMHYNLAVILTNQHNYPAAIREYEKVAELNPNDADAHYNLAVIYDTEMKDNDRALRHYREYVRISPDSKESREVREWIHGKEVQNNLRFEKT